MYYSRFLSPDVGFSYEVFCWQETKTWYIAYMTTATKNQSGLNVEMKAFIVQSIHEALTDPDLGFDLTESFKRKLLAAKRSKKPAISLAEVRRKLHLN